MSQSNLNAAHLPAGEAVPHIYRSLEQAASRFSVAEVAGHLDVEELSSYIREVCDGKGASVEEVDLEPLALAQGATTTLKENGMLWPLDSARLRSSAGGMREGNADVA